MIRSKQKVRASLEERRWLKVLSTLNEFQARLYVADKALDLGRGGISRLWELTGMSRTTITKAVDELKSGKKLLKPEDGMIRQPGAGRKRVEDIDERVLKVLEEILEETTAGDPMSALRWTNKSTQAMALELHHRGHLISDKTVGRCLRQMGYSLQLNAKKREGSQHRDRDAQFRYINRQVRAFSRTHDPVISVDAKKKELVGAFKNAGRTWRPKGRPYEVQVHDFPSQAEGKAIPYGTYDINQNCAVVNVGIMHDTAEFAVESIRRWWKLDGQRRYRSAKRVLICADSGGSNSSRARAWKLHLQQLADETGLSISVCHYPPGTSKWNKVEHRLFSFISLTWRGQPLLNYETVVNLISATKTQTGLKVRAVLDTTPYKTGIEVTKAQMNELCLSRQTTHPQWNYTLSPRNKFAPHK